MDVVFDSSQAFQDPETGEWIQPFDIMPDGSVRLISEEEYLSDLEKVVVEEFEYELPEESVISEVHPNGTFYTYWRFKRSGTRTQVNAPRVKASPDISCTTPTCSAAISVGVTTSNSFSTNVTVERNAIKAGAGYIGFTPYHWRVNGTLELVGNQGTGVINTKSAWGRYPKTLSDGRADGRYAFVYTQYGY